MEENNFSDSSENIETIMDVDLVEGHDNMSDSSLQNDTPQYSLDDESLMMVEEKDDSSSNDIAYEPISTGIPDHKTVSDDIVDDSTEIELLDQQVPIKKSIVSALVINTSKNEYTSLRNNKNDSLNLEKIAIPKTSTPIVKLSSSVSNQIKNTQPISIVSTTSIMQPTTSIARLHQNSSISEINYNKRFSSQKPEFNVTSSNETKTGIYVIPRDGMNYIMRKKFRKEEPTNQTLNSSVSSVIKTSSNIDQRGNQTSINTTSKFVARMQKLKDGTYKLVATQGDMPSGLRNTLKRNTHFIKQSPSSTNEPQFIGIQKSSENFRQFDNTKDVRHFQPKTSGSLGKSSWNKVSKPFDFMNLNRDKKFLPHTATSKDALENHKNIVIENGEIKIKSNGNQEVCTPSSFIQLTPNSESEHQTLSITRYGKITKNENVHENVLSLKCLNEPKTKIIRNERIPSDIYVSKGLKINKAVEKYPNKMLLKDINNEEHNSFSDQEDDDKGQFVTCQNEFCDTLVYEPELIDNLYCSYACKNSKQKDVETEEKTVVPKKPPIDRKVLLARLATTVTKNKTNKRKQTFVPSALEKVARNDDWDVPQLGNLSSQPPEEPPIDENPFPQNSPQKSESPEPEVEDDDDDLIFDLKALIHDKDLLSYMEEMQFKSAPKKLFDVPFPANKNQFMLGQKLEGIDPEHEALFCVMTISEVCGYRIKLHFDGYSDCYDFWVNSDCPDLFYPRWCEHNSRPLQTPKNYSKKFDWTIYLKESRAMPAKKEDFASTKNLKNKTKHKFFIGGKLEALDKLTRTLPKQLICVATVADILGNRIRIHFDGWTDDFDYWTDITSTNIHPIRWCDNNGRSLSPPSGYNDLRGKKSFTWTEYLKETNSEAIPEDAFVRRPLRDFSINMTIEVVDLVNPSIIRVAKIVDVKGDEIKILYDGFNKMYAYWVEDDSPDIHPVGWCLKTDHPLELPSAKNTLWNCKVEGCSGRGNVNGLKTNHIFAKDCPYDLDEWKKAVAGLMKIPDRLKINDIIPITTIATSSQPPIIERNEDERQKNCKLNTTLHNSSLKYRNRIIHNKSNEHLGMKNTGSERNVGVKYEFVKRKIPFMEDMRIRKDIGRTIPLYDLNPLSLAKRGRAWTRHNALLGIPMFDTSDARKWSVKEVASYVDQVVTNPFSDRNTRDQISISDRFIDQKIDGDAFLMLTQEELMKLLKIPLGQAVKLSSAIVMLRQRVPVFDTNETLFT